MPVSEIDVTLGIDNKTVFPGQDPLTNTNNLQYILNKLLATTGPTKNKGGTLIFPTVGSGAVSYKFQGPVTVGLDPMGVVQPFSIIIRGDGQEHAGNPLLVLTCRCNSGS